MLQAEVTDSILRRVPIARQGATCTGTEATLAECPLPRAELVSAGRLATVSRLPVCIHGDDVLLTCFNGPSDRTPSSQNMYAPKDAVLDQMPHIGISALMSHCSM